MSRRGPEQVQQVQTGAGTRPMSPVSGRERQPSLAWRGPRVKPGRRLCNLGNTIYRNARGGRCGLLARNLPLFDPLLNRGQWIPPPDRCSRGPLSAGMAGISREAFHPSTPDDQALGAGCRDGGSNLALRGGAPRPRTTGRTGRTMGVRTVNPGGWRPSTWTGRTLRAASSLSQPLLRGVQPIKRPPESSGASGNWVQTLPSRGSPAAVHARNRRPRGRFPAMIC